MTSPTVPDDLLAIDPAARALLFTEARTANTFSDESVDDATLRAVWDLAQWPPTAANTNPLRVLFVRTPEGRERLLPLMAEGNGPKVGAAPVTAVLAADSRFHDHMPTLFPMREGMKESLEDEERREPMWRFNSALQAGYFLLAARSAGLVTGPMAGFDKDGVDAEFFGGTSWRSILVVNLGHPGDDAWFDRLPRHDPENVLRFA